MRKINYVIITLLIFVAACTSTTNLVGVWQAPDYTGPKPEIKKIMVVALSQNESSKVIVERMFIERLQYLGYEAEYGSNVLVPSIIKKENKEMIEKMMKERNVDGVIILSLLDVKQGTQYVPGTGSYAPGGYYGGYYGYYSYSYNHYYGGTPGYYTTTESIYLEANFYDVNQADGKLVSSMQTESVDPSDIDALADSFSYTVLKELISQNIIEDRRKK
jgi:hypothetical protein